MLNTPIANNPKEQQIKNGIIYLLPILVGGIMPFISLAIFTRVLTQSDFGALALAQIYAVFTTGIANFGMTVAYDRNYFEYNGTSEEKGSLLYSTISFVIINFLVILIITYLFRARLADWLVGVPNSEQLLVWVFCGNFSANISYYYLAFYRNAEAAGKYSFYSILIVFLNFAVSLYLVVWLKTGVIGIAIAQFISGGVVFIMLTILFLRHIPWSWDKEIFFDSLRISYPLTPRIFLGVINTQFDKYILRIFNTTGGVGIYSIGQRVANVAFILMTALQNVYSPRVYKQMFDNTENTPEQIGTYLIPFAYLSVFITFLTAMGAEEVLIILTPPAFHSATDVIMILSMYYGFLFFGKVTSNQLVFARKTYLSSLLSGLNIGLNIGINIFTAQKWGVIGVAWGTFIANFLSGGISVVLAQRCYWIKWPTTRFLVIFLSFFFSTLFILALKSFDIPYGLRLSCKLVLIFMYLGLGNWLGVLTGENFNIIRKTISFRIIKSEKAAASGIRPHAKL